MSSQIIMGLSHVTNAKGVMDGAWGCRLKRLPRSDAGSFLNHNVVPHGDGYCGVGSLKGRKSGTALRFRGVRSEIPG